MKKTFILVMLLVASVAFTSEIFLLVENYEEGTVECPLLEQKLLEVTFTLDKPAYLLISQSLLYIDGAYNYPTEAWFEVNGEKQVFSVSSSNSPYMMSMDSGQVIVQSWVKGFSIPQGTRKVRDPILQVMVFCLSDDEPFVTELPLESSGRLFNYSVLSSGPIVHVEGCSEVYDIAGNKVDCKINNGDVYLNQLSAGTYFATGSNGRTTKIVKLK